MPSPPPGGPKAPVGPTMLLAVLIAADTLFGIGIASRLQSWTARDFGTGLLFLALVGVSIALARSIAPAWHAWRRTRRR